jgi:5-methylcytosine-specific restriction endonuclease McrA
MPSKRKQRQYQTDVIEALHDVLEGCCYLCGFSLSKKGITKDHVFPRSEGYSIGSNMMPAHSKCNLEKGDRFPTQEEIETAIQAYDSIGRIFNPHLPNDCKIMTKPLEYFIHTLKEVA